MNLPHLPPEVEEVVAVEPEPYLRARARETAARVRVPVTVLDGTASDIPAEDGSFDAAIVSLVLCSVPDPASGLAEISRAGTTRSGGAPPPRSSAAADA
jgi:ubiquinone/menaquinone biosynthesis C-methylase UbiE